MASEFTYTNPEAARQQIARLQLQAALAENQSRENIAREQTQAQKYATQSQIAEREKDRQVSREDIAARYGYNSRTQTDKDARERSNIQFNTLRDKILHNQSDPPTKGELEAMLSQSPELTKDLMNDLRSLRDDAYKAAKSNASDGKQAAQNYTARLAEFAKSKFPEQVAKAKESLLNKIGGDKNVIYDAGTGTVVSKWKMPREDGVAAAGMGADYKPGGVLPSASQMQAAGRPAGNTGGIPTIADVYKSRAITGVPEGTQGAISPAQDYGGAALPPTAATITTPAPVPPAAAAPSVNAFGIPTFTGIARSIPLAITPAGGLEFRNPFPRVSELAPPPPAAAAIPPPAFAAPRPAPTFNLPQYQSPAGNMEALLNIARHPDFQTLPPAHQQWILDEIGNAAPRSYDIQTLRPEYIPPVDYYQQ